MKVLSGVCFNKIHKDHVIFIKKTVVLTNDKNNKKDYAISAIERKKQITKLKIANKIIIGEPDNFTKVIEKEKPNIIALGYDQKLPKGTEIIIKKNKIKIIKIRKLGKYGTINLFS